MPEMSCGVFQQLQAFPVSNPKSVLREPLGIECVAQTIETVEKLVKLVGLGPLRAFD
jgi:hypothetical protein